jgi:hypothetical protein
LVVCCSLAKHFIFRNIGNITFVGRHGYYFKKNTKLVLPKEYEADTKVNIQVPLPSNRPLLLHFEKNIKPNQFAWKPKSICSSILNCGEELFNFRKELETASCCSSLNSFLFS